MAAELGKSRPAWPSRLLAIVGYLGLTPLLRLFRVHRHDVYLRQHQAQGLALLVLLLPLLLIWPIFQVIEVYLLRNRVGQDAHHLAADAGITIGFLAGLGIWCLTSMVAIGMTIAGSTRPLPLVAWIACRPRLMGVALFGNSILMAFVVLVVGLAIHASSLVREDAAMRENAVPAPVYYLYDSRDSGFLGAWGPKLQALFCYPISRLARERWGPGSVVMAPLTAENFRTAITHGRFVVQIGHGSSGAFATEDGWSVQPNFPATEGTLLTFARRDAAPLFAMPGQDLQFVYVSACHGGDKATEWEQRFAPAEIVTFDRLSGPLEHLWWLWFDAPDRLKEIR